MLICAGERGLFTLNDAGDIGDAVYHGKQFMAMASHASTVVVSIFKKGVIISTDCGQSWQDITEDLPYTDVRSLAIDPQCPTRIYAGTEPANIYCYEGSKWVSCGDLSKVPESKDWSFPVPPKVPHVRSIVVDPTNSNTIYALIEVGSFLISHDRGETWKAATGVGHDLHRVIVHPGNTDVLIAATGTDTGVYKGGQGIYRSEDAGETWRQANDGLEHRIYCEDAIGFAENDANTVFLAAADGIPPHWASLIKLTIGALKGNVYFLSPSKLRRRKGADITIYRSVDAGASWLPVPDKTQHALFDMVWALETGLSDDGRPAVYYGTTGGEICASFDGGDSWGLLANNLGAITHLHPMG
ncbi:sialidase family protein [Cycloclasticus sp. P1]|jgi:photosystem II stability/assembly factor-like uncharacterized protein|uniref:WD40/YVTN/BNR-like repeat-containing protein n=1 Tax=Cycloclasticus sp. (strain P1) TaxID=385025 RepID=UPI000286ACAB|nr:sialidase family protein [Cycloclasticus sp. P1]AFT66912.1 hypothetical protein Q91_0874 [Cycloclasticus sp. P1]KXJ48221.1 MAG: hypothetical protein AXW16_02820 [Cycloclasticus sp. Phe_18]MBV1928527.1 hypothetical protein [Gammaproteobacteria bacterium]